MSKNVNIAVLGYGQVGSGLVNLLNQQRDFIQRRTGIKLNIRRILVRDIKKSRPVKPGGLTDKIDDILNDPEINIVVELLGGLRPARDYIIRALEKGKDVVTANKMVMAYHSREIMDAAMRHSRKVRYEAAVCAGIPIIRAIEHGLLANHITLLMGILNGTTNYILTRMSEEGLPFPSALKEAQKYGFAEPDPRMDINGSDTAHKLAILTNLSFGISVKPDDIYTEGITAVSPEDVKNAQEFGYVIKLLAIAREVERNQIELKVHPTMIPKIHPLSSVRNEFNALYLRGSAVGEMMFYGRGAGPMPTASALLSDIIELAQHINGKQRILKCQRLSKRSVPESLKRRQPFMCWGNKKVIPMDETVSEHYLRFPIVDKAGVIGKIATVLGKYNISIYGATASLVPVHPAHKPRTAVPDGGAEDKAGFMCGVKNPL
ncbi:MAG: homoserine dehydrogenase, partial [Planctomycetota bacterium]|nr:homoserine dehydrogenase [Planctomycetota bacterium]